VQIAPDVKEILWHCGMMLKNAIEVIRGCTPWATSWITPEASKLPQNEGVIRATDASKRGDGERKAVVNIMGG